MQNFGFRIVFQTGPNLKNILYKNKDKLIPNSYPGVYKLKCSCVSVYNNESKKKIISRSIEHQQESIKGNWSSSGATEHKRMWRSFRLFTAPKLSPWKIGIMTGKWGIRWRWTKTMGTLLRQMRGNLWSKKMKTLHWNLTLFCIKHTVRLTIWHHLFLEFWLVDTWFFIHWGHQRAVTRLENVRQLNIRRGKKLGF